MRNHGLASFSNVFFTVRLVEFLALLIPTQADVNTTIEHGSGYNVALFPFEEVARQPVWSCFAFFLNKVASFFLFSIFRVISSRDVFLLI